MNEDFKLKDIYDKYRENKNSHVYLVETNNVDYAINDIKKLIVNINIYNNNDISILMENDSLPTLLIVAPKLQEIVTEDVEKLIALLQRIPVITKENYFIVSEAEKLNKKSGNQMLKIIEDPETEMLGFFVCSSVDNVMPTIVSRAQTISLIYDFDEKFDEELNEDAIKYLQDIHSGKTLIINKYYVDKYKETILFSSFVKCLIFNQKKFADNQTNSDIINKEVQILKLLYGLLSKLGSNCNSNLLLDKFLIEVSRL